MFQPHPSAGHSQRSKRRRCAARRAVSECSVPILNSRRALAKFTRRSPPLRQSKVVRSADVDRHWTITGHPPPAENSRHRSTPARPRLQIQSSSRFLFSSRIASTRQRSISGNDFHQRPSIPSRYSRPHGYYVLMPPSENPIPGITSEALATAISRSPAHKKRPTIFPHHAKAASSFLLKKAKPRGPPSSPSVATGKRQPRKQRIHGSCLERSTLRPHAS